MRSGDNWKKGHCSQTRPNLVGVEFGAQLLDTIWKVEGAHACVYGSVTSNSLLFPSAWVEKQDWVACGVHVCFSAAVFLCPC